MNLISIAHTKTSLIKSSDKTDRKMRSECNKKSCLSFDTYNTIRNEYMRHVILSSKDVCTLAVLLYECTHKLLSQLTKFLLN